MSEQTTTIISKVWGMCGPLRDDGVSYGDYLEQLTYLIFLKMSDEYAKPVDFAEMCVTRLEQELCTQNFFFHSLS